MAVFVFLRNRFPEPEARCFASITYDECHYLPRSTTHGGPQPPRLLFLLDKTPYLIKFEHIIRRRRQKRFFDIRQFLRMLSQPPRNRLPCHGKDPCHSTQTATLETSSQHALLLRFRIYLRWLEHAIRTTVLAMVLSVSTAIGSIFDNMGTLTDTADVRCCFLNHALSITRHLPSNHYPEENHLLISTCHTHHGPESVARRARFFLRFLRPVAGRCSISPAAC